MGNADPINTSAGQILKVYITLTLLSTFASSFIWGINTLFLLDAGLTITEAFLANAFFTVGQVLFEVPTGVAADTLGRRTSYLLGSATLFVSTLLYLWLWQIHGPLWAWAVVSMLLGLGFTFFSGATEAWLVDGLNFAKYTGTLESAFAKGQIAGGVAMLTGTLIGGAIAQATSLGVPYILRAIVLAMTFLVAFISMQDIGFTPKRDSSVRVAMRGILKSSLDHGFGHPPVRWLILAGPFSGGVGIYAFYAMQPYLLELYGKGNSYAIAGLAAAMVAGAQIIGGYIVPYVRKVFRRRTSFLLFGAVMSAVSLALIGLASTFWLALSVFGLWAIIFAATIPVRQMFINRLIPSEERATVLSFDNLLNSSGGIVVQPALGKVAAIWSYSISDIVGGGIELMAVPFILLARREKATSDHMAGESSESSPSRPPLRGRS